MLSPRMRPDLFDPRRNDADQGPPVVGTVLVVVSVLLILAAWGSLLWWLLR